MARCPRFASVLWTLTWAQSGFGLTARRYSDFSTQINAQQPGMSLEHRAGGSEELTCLH